MVSVKITGVFRTRKVLADGTVKEYWYHRATMTPLPGSRGGDEFLAAYIEANKVSLRDQDTLKELFRVYGTSRKFTHNRKGQPKALSTTHKYLRMLRELDSAFGSMPIKTLESPKVNAVFIDYHEEIAQDRPREADNRMGLLSTVLAEAKRRGRITRNPLEGFERAYSGDRSEIIWTEPDIQEFMQDAPVELQEAMILAIHTGQRYGDLIRLPWSAYDGEVIRLIQSKTKAKVPVPVTEALRHMLDAMPRRGPFILTRPDGRPWHTAANDKELGKYWRHHMEKAGSYPRPFEELTKAEKQTFLHFNDLRGTAVTMLTEAGCTVQEVCSITGHTLESATRNLRRYLAMTEAIARAAILRFENSTATRFANQLQTKQRSGTSH